MKVVVFHTHPDALTGEVMTAFAQGADAELVQTGIYKPCDVAVIFGLVKWEWKTTPYPKSTITGMGCTTTVAGARRLMKHRFIKRGASVAKAKIITEHNGPVVVVEKGYVDRDHYWAAGIGGINGRADFGGISDQGDRWAKLGIEPKPWDPRGDYILVIGQVPWDVSVQDSNHVGWCGKITSTLDAMGYKVRFRPHPHAVKSGANYNLAIPLSQAKLADDLAGAKCVITFNSNTGVDATLAGKPVIAFDDGSMVRELAGRGIEAIEHPKMPDRSRWCQALAYAQWSPAEFAQGKAWRHLRPRLELALNGAESPSEPTES